jgi:tRNA-modifying protein YgfZ
MTDPGARTPAPRAAHPAHVTLGEVAGRSVVVAYSSAAAEYAALQHHAVVVDRSHRLRMRFTGDVAPATLAGLVTNDVESLEPGQGQYAAALTPKGKILADVRIFRLEGSLLVDTGVRAGEAWTSMVRKYVNPRLAKYGDESASLCDIGIYGPQARHVIARMTGANATALGVLPMYAHVTVRLEGPGSHEVVIARVPELGVEGFELFAPVAANEWLWEQALGAECTPMGLAAWEIARVEAGRPEWGLDLDDNTIPQEANFDDLHAISYTKGCYTGQEVVARVHFRGRVNRLLRGLVATGSEPPPTGASLVDADGRVVGDVRSSVISPRLGGIAMGMVRREQPPGTTLVASWDEDGVARELTVEVTALPFRTPA